MHGRLAAGWILLFYDLFAVFRFRRISRIFIWQAAADQSAAAGSIMKFLGNTIAVPGPSRMCTRSSSHQSALGDRFVMAEGSRPVMK